MIRPLEIHQNTSHNNGVDFENGDYLSVWTEVTAYIDKSNGFSLYPIHYGNYHNWISFELY